MHRSLNTPLSFLTVGEFLDLLNSVEKPKVTEIKTEYVHGLSGLANILGCSKTTAWKVKKSGILNSAITQRGRKIIIDKHLAIKLYKDARD